jgi:transposase-like protein
MPSSKIIGIAFSVLVTFSVVCAIFIYTQQRALHNAEVSSQIYQEEKLKLLNKLDTDKSFREKLVDESLQHRHVIESLEKKLSANQHALQQAKAATQTSTGIDPVNISPETVILRERVTLLESSVSEHDQENRLLKLALTKSDASIADAERLTELEHQRAESIYHDYRRERRRKILFAIGGAVVGAGIGAGIVAVAAH